MKHFLASIVAVALLLATGCGDAPQEADFRFISTSAHHFLDPQKMSWSHDIRVIECLFETLVRVNPLSDDIEPAAAERWSVSDDGLTYTFHLRPNARWSNGDPVTANDFIYAWRRGMLPDLAADYTQLFYVIDGAKAFFDWRVDQLEDYLAPDAATGHTTTNAHQLWSRAQQRFAETVGIKAENDHTLVIRLARPTAYFLELCAFATLMPVHPASVEQHVTLNESSGMLVQNPVWTKPEHIVGNGPYTLTTWEFKRRLLLTANPHYWDRASMGNESIMELIVENPQTALLKYDQGEADWLPSIPTALPIAADLVASSRDDIHTGPAAGTYFYNFNCLPKFADGTPNPLADSRVRRALSMAIDRQVIVNKVTRLGDRQPTASTFIPPDTLPGYSPPADESPARFDPTAARALLATAGYSHGAALTGLSILYNTEGGHSAIAQQIKHSWQTHLGVTVQLQAVESTHFSERLKNQDYTICRSSWFGDYRDPTTFLDKFLTGNGNNDCAWSDPDFDRLMADAAAERNPAARLALLRAAEHLMLQAQPIAPIYHYINLWVYNPRRVTGLPLNPWKIRRLDRVRVSRSDR